MAEHEHDNNTISMSHVRTKGKKYKGKRKKEWKKETRPPRSPASGSCEWVSSHVDSDIRWSFVLVREKIFMVWVRPKVHGTIVGC